MPNRIKSKLKKTNYRCDFFLFFISILFLVCTGCISQEKYYTLGEHQNYINNIGIEYFNIASEYEKQKNYKEAIVFYTKCLKYDIFTENELRYKIALNSAKNKDWDVAIENYELLLRQDRSNRIIKKSLAYVYASNTDIIKALNLYDSMFTENPLDADCTKNYIYTLLANKDSEKAITIFESYKENFPEYSDLEKIQKLVYPEKKDSDEKIETPLDEVNPKSE